MTTRRRTRRSPLGRPTPAALLAAGALLLGACSRESGRRATYLEQAVAIAPDVERATGLRFTTPPKVEVRAEREVRGFVQRTLDEPGARAELDAQAMAYKRLGVVPDTLDLRALLQRALEEQVVGYYDPKTKTLYIRQGADTASAGVTLRHELVHALQDQYLNLDSLLAVRGQADRSTAAQAALEGQATWVQLGGGGDFASRTPGGWDRIRRMIRDNTDRSPTLSTAPLVVREGLLFPYLSGAELARAVAGAGHPDSLLRRLPASTEQVLHAERYLGAKGAPPDAPIAVTLPAPRVGSVVAENTLGEFETRLVLFQHLNDLGTAAQAAGGWGGDRWAVVRTPAGDAFVWVTTWDRGVDAAEFFDAATRMVSRRYDGARETPVKTPTTHLFAADRAPGGARAVLVRATEVQGRPVVLYVDAPAAAGTDLLDVARVTFGR